MKSALLVSVLMLASLTAQAEQFVLVPANRAGQIKKAVLAQVDNLKCTGTYVDNDGVTIKPITSAETLKNNLKAYALDINDDKTQVYSNENPGEQPRLRIAAVYKGTDQVGTTDAIVTTSLDDKSIVRFDVRYRRDSIQVKNVNVGTLEYPDFQDVTVVTSSTILTQTCQQ